MGHLSFRGHCKTRSEQQETISNGTVLGLNGDDGDEASFLAMNLGRESDEAMRCALYGKQFRLKEKLVEAVEARVTARLSQNN